MAAPLGATLLKEEVGNAPLGASIVKEEEIPTQNLLGREGVKELSEFTGEDSKTLNKKIDKAEFYSSKSGLPMGAILDLVDDMPDIDPVYFPMNDFIEKEIQQSEVGSGVDQKLSINDSLNVIARPFLAQGYKAAEALNNGMASFSMHLGAVQEFLFEHGPLRKEEGEVDIWDKAAKTYEENSEFWKTRADKVGIGFIDELVGEAVGGAVPGVGQFMLDVASGLTFPFAAGTTESGVTGGIMEAAKTGTLHYLFKAISPLRQYLKAPTMGTVFGIEESAQAPEGEKLKKFVKGFGTGILYSASSPGGQMGLNELVKPLKKATKEAVKDFNPKLDAPKVEKKLKKDFPEMDIRFEGEFDRSAIGKEPLYQFTPQEGPLKGRTISVEKPSVRAVKTKLDELAGVETAREKVFEGAKNISKDVKSVITKAKKITDEYLGAISTRLSNINPELGNALRKFEFKSGVKKVETTKKILPVVETVKEMHKFDRLAFDLARKNSDVETISKLSKKYNIEPGMKDVRKVLDSLHDEAKKVGIDIPYRKDYHPRVLKDHEGFLEYTRNQKEWAVFQRAIKEQEVKLGRYLEQEEKANLINSMINAPRGGGLAQKKGRTVNEVTPELNKFYMDSDAALTKYINELSDAISAKRFFGVTRKKLVEDNIENTVGDYVSKLIDQKKIDPNKEKELKEILMARFNEIGPSGLFGLYKNISYIDTMGSPISAVTQIGDVAWSLYKAGILKTGTAFKEAVKGESKLTKEDLGIERIAAEFSDKTKSAKAVEWVFEKTGLTKMDNIGKETLINAEYKRLVEKARKDPQSLEKELSLVFEGETKQLVNDIKDGKITENVKLHIFNTLADFQPIALSEMPAKYLTGGNGRIFYMLKSFTLKQFDVYRREVFKQIKNKDTRKQGIKNLIKLSGAFVAANASADTIKSIILNRPLDPDDLVVDNLLRLFGISKFVTWKAREEGVGSAMVRQIAPPFKLVDALSKDINKAGDEKGLESTASIPLIGKLYYWWFGKGKGKIEKRQNNGIKSNL
jgi:hypothetical protein